MQCPHHARGNSTGWGGVELSLLCGVLCSGDAEKRERKK